MPPKPDPMIELGVITGAHGVSGEVRLKSFADRPGDIANYDGLVLSSGQAVRVMRLKPAKSGFIARLEDIGTRNAAEALKGEKLLLPRRCLPAVEDGEFYHADLVGLAVDHVDGRRIGEVVAVLNFGAGDLIEVALAPGGKTVLLPFTEQTAPKVDLEGGVIVADPPAGLIDE